MTVQGRHDTKRVEPSAGVDNGAYGLGCLGHTSMLFITLTRDPNEPYD